MNEVKQNLVVLGLGSNLGNRYVYLMQAIELISNKLNVDITKSNVYSSPPWGLKEQPGFLNMVVKFQTEMEVRECHKILQEIEVELGKKTMAKWGPRCIDIDILFFGDTIIETKELEIPHPHLHERDFVIFPLKQILPNLKHPKLNKDISEIATSLKNELKVFKLSD